MSSCTTNASNTVAVSVTRGDTMRLGVVLADEAGAPVDVTGWSWLCQLRTDPDDVAMAPIQVAVVDAPKGSIELSLAPELTATLPVRDFTFDLQATDVEADVKTLLNGQLRVKADVSR